MPDKEGSDDEKKSTKSVVNKKQKQFMNQEELDLTKIAEALGGYIVEGKKDQADMGSGTGALNPNKPNRKNKKVKVTSDADRVIRGERKPDKELTTNPDTRAKEQAKSDIGPDFRKGSYSTDNVAVDPNLDPLKADIKNKPTVKDDGTRTVGGKVRTYKIGDTPPEGKVAKAQRLKREAEAAKNKPKVKVSQALKTAERPVIKGGPSVKRGDPVEKRINPTERPEPIKKKPVPKIGGYQFNTFSPKEVKKRKTFKQAFGRPTGADPKTGKPTYRVSPVGPAGEKRKRTRGGFKALPRSKNLPDYDTTKTAVDMGLNPDEIDKNKFIDKKVRGDRMDKLGTPDPFKVDTSQASKEVAKQFGTKPVKGGLDFGEPTVPKKVKTQDPLTGRDFKRFRKQQQTAIRTKVRSDIEKNIGKVAKRNVSKAKIATPVVKTLGKETGEAAVKAAGKRALKKAGMKAVAKQIPGVGSLIAGGEAAFRAAKGDMTGAALSLGQAIPGVSIPLAGVDVAREVARARGGAKVGQKVATQVARSLPGSGKKVKTATKVVNPTVVGSAADTSKRFRDFLNKNKMMGVAGGAALGKGVEVASRNTFRGLRPKDVKGGRVGRRSAKQ